MLSPFFHVLSEGLLKRACQEMSEANKQRERTCVQLSSSSSAHVSTTEVSSQTGCVQESWLQPSRNWSPWAKTLADIFTGVIYRGRRIPLSLCHPFADCCGQRHARQQLGSHCNKRWKRFVVSRAPRQNSTQRERSFHHFKPGVLLRQSDIFFPEG